MADKNYLVGGIGTGTNFEIGAKAPIDSRFTVLNAEGLNELLTYEGLVSYNSANKKYYQYVDSAWKELSVNSPEELATIIKGLIATETTGAMEFKGVAATLPENPAKGDMYKVAGENIDIKIDEVAAKTGDTIVYNGEQWFLIPSGDDIEDTWRPVIAGGNTLETNETLELVAGDNVTITEEGGKVTISSQYEDTHYESKLVVGNEATDATDEGVVENGNVHLNLVEDGVVKSSHKIVGAGGISVTHTTDAENGNVITIEAPEGAKYDLAAKTENNEAIVSLAGTDNTEDKVAFVGDDAVSVSVVDGKVVITAHDTTYGGSEGAEVKVTVANGAISAELVEVGLDKLAEEIQTKLGYVDTGKNITTAIADAIAALSTEGGAIYNIVKDNGTIDTKIGAAIEGLALETTYVKEEGFDGRVAAIEVNKAKEAGHATSADNATEATHAVNADNATNATNAVNAENAKEAEHADEADHALNADHATNATNAENAKEAEHAAEADHAENADEATHAAAADTATHADSATKVDKALTVKVGGETKVYDGSAEVEADVDAAIKAAVDAIPEVVHPEYSITKDAAPGAYGAVYHLTKDGAIIGEAINIPKDMVVQSGSVVVATEADKALDSNVVVGKTYIKLVIQNVAIPLYIAADQLIEYVTSGSTADSQVIVAISDDHKVTATIGAGKVGTTELADKGVTEAKLEQNVQDALALARTAIQSHQDISGKADKVQGAVAGNFAALDANGNLADSGKKADDFATKAQGDKADTAIQEVAAGEGLKATKDGTKVTVDIDTDVIFILDCNW